MTEKYLIVVDMQKDFVDGALGSREAQAMVPELVKKVTEFEGEIIFTKDTHGNNYFETQEGKLLPVAHCIEDTDGWELIEPLQKIAGERDAEIFRKETFGCTELASYLKKIEEAEGIKEIELVGVCTDICVVSNALLIKANIPEVKISVDAKCCAGVTPSKHEAALETMRSCQINVR